MRAATRAGVKEFYGLVKSQKDMLWTEGEQTNFYDLEPQVTTVAQAVIKHFDSTLQENKPGGY